MKEFNRKNKLDKLYYKSKVIKDRAKDLKKVTIKKSANYNHSHKNRKLYILQDYEIEGTNILIIDYQLSNLPEVLVPFIDVRAKIQVPGDESSYNMNSNYLNYYFEYLDENTYNLRVHLQCEYFNFELYEDDSISDYQSCTVTVFAYIHNRRILYGIPTQKK